MIGLTFSQNFTDRAIISIITRQNIFYYKGEGSIKSIIHVIMIVLKSLMPPSKTSLRAALRILVLP